MFFSQKRENWLNTGIKIFWLEMRITNVWCGYLYILLRKIVIEPQRAEFKGL